MLWFLVAAMLLAIKWGDIVSLNLSDADDNARLAQVRDLLSGQGWRDLRQHRAFLPGGMNMHWTRVADLPIAAIVAGLRGLIGQGRAETVAVATTPLLAMLAVMLGAARSCAHLRISPLIGAGVAAATAPAVQMFMPLRIDHHGWQLALLAWCLAGRVDPNERRGGIIMGLAIVTSIAIGLENAPYLILFAVSMLIPWIRTGAERDRMRSVAETVLAAAAPAYLAFASYDNMSSRCDAFTPPVLGALIVSSLAVLALIMRTPLHAGARLSSALAIGSAATAICAWAWPQCAGAPEKLSDEAVRYWFQYIAEAQPIWNLSPTAAASLMAPLLFATAGLLAAHRSAMRLAPEWRIIALFIYAGMALSCWQIRMTSGAAIVAVPAAALFVQMLTHRAPTSGIRIAATIGGTILAGGLPIAALIFAVERLGPGYHLEKARIAAENGCREPKHLQALNHLAPGVVASLPGLAPRLLVHTHHSVLVGPYHREAGAIAATLKAFRSDIQAARQFLDKVGADYIAICRTGEAEIIRTENPNGFYARLEAGRNPSWARKVDLPGAAPISVLKVHP